MMGFDRTCDNGTLHMLEHVRYVWTDLNGETHDEWTRSWFVHRRARDWFCAWYTADVVRHDTDLHAHRHRRAGLGTVYGFVRVLCRCPGNGLRDLHRPARPPPCTELVAICSC